MTAYIDYKIGGKEKNWEEKIFMEGKCVLETYQQGGGVAVGYPPGIQALTKTLMLY